MLFLTLVFEGPVLSVPCHWTLFTALSTNAGYGPGYALSLALDDRFRSSSDVL